MIGAARGCMQNMWREDLGKHLHSVALVHSIFSLPIREPKLFQILFMKEQGEILDVRHVLSVIDDNYEKILSSLMEGYQLEEAVAERIYRHLWIYSHGIAALCATKMCRFTKEEIEQMMAEVFRGLLIQELKGGKA